MPKIEFGSLEMAPTKSISTSSEWRNEGQESPTIVKSKVLQVSDMTMPEADEPVKLEEIPLTASDERTRHVTSCRIIGINKAQLTTGSAPRYMFMVELSWDDGAVSFVNRDHDDFFRYHCWLLDTFRREAGHCDAPRAIPLLPGKKWFRNDVRLADERRPLLETYLNELTKIKRIRDSKQAQAFFGRRPGDPKQDDPILQEAILEFEEDHVTSSTREQSKLVIGGIPISTDAMRGSHENATFQPDPDDDIDATTVDANQCNAEDVTEPRTESGGRDDENLDEHL